nr:xylosidase/arabinosidase [uncultured bacterium]
MKKFLTNARTSDEVTEREIKHRKLARDAAGESIVLLKNDGSLPVKPCPVALYGAGAATTIKGGTGSGEVNERYSVTIEQGLKNAGFTITTDPWLREYEKLLKTEKTAANKALAKKLLSSSPDDRINIMANGFQYPAGRPVTDTDIQGSKSEICIYVIARQSGECSDRRLEKNDFTLTDTEIDNLKLAASSYKKTFVIINTAGPMDMTPLEKIDGINAIIFFCQQGMEGGNALADIVTGKVTPSGCLTSTWPVKYEDLPNAMEYSYLKNHTDFEEYKEGIYVGYRYFDSFRVTPYYEFGYGLSYNNFTVEYISTFVDKTKITVKAKVTNSWGAFSGKKCVQLYVSVPNGKLQREFKSLAAFAKTGLLAPEQSQELTLDFDITDLAGYDEQNASFILEQGKYVLHLGESSRNTKIVSVLTLESSVVTEVCTNVCKVDRDLKEIKPEIIPINIPDGIQSYPVSPADIKTRKHEYNIPKPVLSRKTEEILDTLDIDDMIKVVVATGMTDAAPHFCVPGAAANTTSHLVEKGVPNAALCDGPAGLRIQRRSVRLKNGVIKPVEAMMEFMAYMPWFFRKLIFGNPKKGTALYQYTSAFPVGTALAQTWNTQLVEQTGIAVGTEMTEYGVTFLLAPGMNIQRNPLCGRNYEYYSEDPLLTGKMAAASTRGVQSFNGCYVTIKHYAANNQETNRHRSNSVINERALREIYLKGFRIAVEEAGAKAVMTSYNKLNGIYTPNNFDLCTKLLRCEWDFDGVVMTDWYATNKGLAGNGLSIKAGNDLICPGGSYNCKELKNDLEAGIFNLEDLRLSCSRVLEAVINGRTGKSSL